MTPQQKAQELFDKMSNQTYSYQPYAGARYATEEIGWEAGKKCALIAVNEIIEATKDDWSHNPYWEQVRKEIEAL